MRFELLEVSTACWILRASDALWIVRGKHCLLHREDRQRETYVGVSIQHCILYVCHCKLVPQVSLNTVRQNPICRLGL
jgi:hypothetical protein